MAGMITPIGRYKMLVLIFAFTTTTLGCNNQWESSPQFPYNSSPGLPNVDLKDLKAPIKLASALKEWGFSYVTGHEVSDDVISEAMVESKKFFDLPMRVKRSVSADRERMVMKTTRGYTGIKLEQLDAKGKPDLKEVFDVGYVTKKGSTKPRHYLGPNKWPKTETKKVDTEKSGESRTRRHIPSALQHATEMFAEHASKLAEKVLDMAAMGIGCDKAFVPVFGPDALQVQRLTRYPPRQDLNNTEAGEIGAGVHSDYGGITVLHAEGPGLYVLKPNRSSSVVESATFAPELTIPNSEQWLKVDSIPGTLIVMAGESLQRLSNGHIYAAKHKVDHNGSMARYSLAFFYDPQPEAVLEPLTCFKKNGKSLYQPKVAGHKGVIRNAFNILKA